MRFFSFLTVQPGDDAIARRARWLIIALTTWLAIEMFVSLHWRLALDSPLLYYFAFLQEQYGFVPYRDFFDTSFPGAIFFYRALTAVTGYSDLAFRLCDLALLLALLAMSYHLLSTLGRDAARFSVVIFGLVYLGHGFYMSMEREFVALLPVAAALLVATQATRVSNVQRLLLVGALFGVAASIKPHLALGVMPVLGYLAVRDHHDGCTSDLVIAILRNGIIALSGFTIMFALPLLWLWWRGGLPAFSEIVQHYLPLYLNLNGDREKMSGSVRLLYLVKQWRLGQAPFWMAAALGAWIALQQGAQDNARRALVWLLFAEAVVYSFYPVFSGQFWIYHWLPFLWCACLLSGCLVLPLFETSWLAALRQLAFVVLVLFLLLTQRPLDSDMAQVMRGKAQPEMTEDRAAAYLREHLQAGDTVQSLDFFDNSMTILLRAHAKLATPFFCDFYFYHDVSQPYIQQLRQRFITRLEAAPPRFIVDSSGKSRPFGPDTTTQFEAFEQFQAAHYHVAWQEGRHVIYERNL